MSGKSKNDAKQMLGIPSKEQIMLSPGRTDTVPAQIQNGLGQLTGPAALTEGEFVFSNPAIIALGQGDHQAGIDLLTEMHNKLKTMGEQLMGQKQGEMPQGIAALQQ